MTRLAWILALFLGAGSFIFIGWSRDNAAKDRRDAVERLDRQKEKAAELVHEAQIAVDAMRSDYETFMSRVRNLESRHEEIATASQRLASEIEEKDRRVDELEAETAAAKTVKQRNLEEIQELKDDIPKLEEQVAYLNDLIAMIQEPGEE